MYRYAFVTAGSENYVAGLKAQINSINHWHENAEIILLAWRLPQKFLGTLPGNVIVIESQHEHQVQGTAIERFRIAYDFAEYYEAICLLDADMFLTANCDLWFEAAAKGFIVTGSNGMIIDFDSEYQKKYHVDLGVPSYPYFKTHTTVPIFISEADMDWFKMLYEARRVDSFDDFLYLNILGIKLEKDKKMICMAPYMFTGIHHWQVKVETGIYLSSLSPPLSKGGITQPLVLSGTEEQVFMMHGKWWDAAWRNNLWTVMEPYLRDHDMGNWCGMRVREAIELEYRQFCFYRDLEK